MSAHSSDSCQVEKQQEPHHIEIQNAVKALSGVINQLDGLLSEIKNGDDGPKVAKENPPPMPVISLGTVLNETASDIQAKRERMQELISEIRNELF